MVGRLLPWLALAVVAFAAPLPADAGRRRRATQTQVVTLEFRDAACPSFYAPASCSGAPADSCHEAYVEGGPSDGCVSALGGFAEYLVPEDGPGDGGTSRAWSFAVRPQGRSFAQLLHPELTGSVRAKGDGLGVAGSRTGAADQAHVRLRSMGPGLASRLLVLRWFTGSLPADSEARLRIATQNGVLFETSQLEGPPVAQTEVIPVTWSGTLDITVSAAVTAARDLSAPSADLLWHLAVLTLLDDADHCGYANGDDPDPLDRNVPTPAGPSSRPKVLVLGVDGAGWDVWDVLADGGHLPTIDALVGAGVRAPLDETGANPNFCCFCPPVWSSLGTGRPQSQHAMNLFESEPWDRGVPSVWTVLAGLGGTTTHISYRNTFPAEPGSTYSVSEVGLVYAGHQVHDAWPALSERGEQMNRLQMTWPPLLFETLNILPATEPRLPALRVFAKDRVATESIVRLVALEKTDLTLWILHAPDKTEHINWPSLQQEHGVPIDSSVLLAQAAAWDGPVFSPAPFGWGTTGGQNVEADAQLARLLEVASYDYVMIVSDHAMTLRPSYPNGGLPGHHISQPAFHGVFSLTGPGVVPGLTLPPVSILDIAPTVAYLLGISVADNLPGRVLTEAFTAEHLAANPILTSARW